MGRISPGSSAPAAPRLPELPSVGPPDRSRPQLRDDAGGPERPWKNLHRRAPARPGSIHVALGSNPVGDVSCRLRLPSGPGGPREGSPGRPRPRERSEARRRGSPGTRAPFPQSAPPGRGLPGRSLHQSSGLFKASTQVKSTGGPDGTLPVKAMACQPEGRARSKGGRNLFAKSALKPNRP